MWLVNSLLSLTCWLISSFWLASSRSDRAILWFLVQSCCVCENTLSCDMFLLVKCEPGKMLVPFLVRTVCLVFFFASCNHCLWPLALSLVSYVWFSLFISSWCSHDLLCLWSQSIMFHPQSLQSVFSMAVQLSGEFLESEMALSVVIFRHRVLLFLSDLVCVLWLLASWPGVPGMISYRACGLFIFSSAFSCFLFFFF